MEEEEASQEKGKARVRENWEKEGRREGRIDFTSGKSQVWRRKSGASAIHGYRVGGSLYAVE